MAASAALQQPTKTTKQDAVPVDMARSRMMQRVKSLQISKQAPEPTLRDIQTYIAPYRGRFNIENNSQRGQRKGLKVINNTAGRSMKILASGLMAGLTSPGRPWFKLGTPDPDLSEFTPVRQWLDDSARAMRAVLARSNFYNVLPSIYGELGPFGTSAMLETEDAQSVVRFYPYTIGSYSIAQSDRLVVDTLAREYVATVIQVVARFGTERLSSSAMNAYRQGKLEHPIQMVHLIQPNANQTPGGFGWLDMPYIEEYWEKGSENPEPLLRTGYRERAHFVPRWDVTGDDLWGTGLGHDVLGDVKQLQFLERRKEEVLEKHTAPPLEAGVELRGKRISLLSGDVNYTNPAQTGGTQIKPIMTTDPNAYRYAAEDIRDKEGKIREACFEDLFLMLANDTRSGITAREVEERHQEKMLVLGPVLERLNEEMLDPIIDRTFGVMQRQSRPVWEGTLGGMALLPPPPEDLQDSPIIVEYTSILAQAAKATNTRGLEAFGMFVGQTAQLAPEVLDKVDFDQYIDEYADAQGIPARVIRDDDTVQQIRSGRAQAQQMQQMAQMAPALKDGAAAMKDLSETVPQPGSMAENMAGAAGGLAP